MTPRSPAVPPGPTDGLLGIGLLKRMQVDILGHCMDLQKAHGDAVHYRVGPVRVFQFTHPDQNFEALVTHHRSFHKPAYVKRVLGPLIGIGLALGEGDLWVRQRRLVSPAFKLQRIALHAPAIAARVGRMLDGWAGQAEIDVSPDLARLTLGIVAEALFGTDVERHTDQLIAAMAVFNEIALHELSSPIVLPLWAPTPQKRRLRRAVETIRGIVRGVVAGRRRTGDDRGDFLSMLLLAVDEEGDGGRMSDQQACDESMSFMLAGNETTATALTWALYLLAGHPAIQEEARREVDAVLGQSLPTAAALPGLRRVDMILKEAMRLYPPVHLVVREAIENVSIGGYSVPRGSAVHLVPYLTQRDGRWFDDPETFRPGRFAAEDTMRKGSWMPFGAGPRACIGRSFAMQGATIALAMLLQRYILRIPTGAEPVAMEAQVSLHPKGGLRLAVGRRS